MSDLKCSLSLVVLRNEYACGLRPAGSECECNFAEVYLQAAARLSFHKLPGRFGRVWTTVAAWFEDLMLYTT